MTWWNNELEEPEEILTPSYHGELCRHNGDNPDYEIACDECPYYLACFPDWQYLEEKYGDSDEKASIQLKHPLMMIWRLFFGQMPKRITFLTKK